MNSAPIRQTGMQAATAQRQSHDVCLQVVQG